MTRLVESRTQHCGWFRGWRKTGFTGADGRLESVVQVCFSCCFLVLFVAVVLDRKEPTDLMYNESHSLSFWLPFISLIYLLWTVACSKADIINSVIYGLSPCSSASLDNEGIFAPAHFQSFLEHDCTTASMTVPQPPCLWQKCHTWKGPPKNGIHRYLGSTSEITAAMRSQTATLTWRYYVAAIKYSFVQADKILPKISVFKRYYIEKQELVYCNARDLLVCLWIVPYLVCCGSTVISCSFVSMLHCIAWPLVSQHVCVVFWIIYY